jgi:signal transduction histidine kinase
VLVLAASLTGLLLGAALAASGAGHDRALLLAASAAFLVTLATGGILLASRGNPDPASERARAAADLAEELHEPLLSLRALSTSGLRSGRAMSDEDRAAFFGLIDEETARLRRTLDQLVTALEIEADGVVYATTEEDLGALVEEVCGDVPHGEHPLLVETEPDLRVRVDRLRLGETLAAVVDNAARFSPPDAPIQIRAFRSDGEAVLEVADHGPGIPFEHRAEVFRRGTTWRPAGYEETPGAGIGLFVARALVLGQGGRIELDDRSREGRGDISGTVVRIGLPSAG